MSILEEIVEWSQDRPAWQRDALRRLVLNGELSDEDIRLLTEICKSSHGLAEQQELVLSCRDQPAHHVSVTTNTVSQNASTLVTATGTQRAVTIASP